MRSVGRAFSTSYLAGEAVARELFPRSFRDRGDRAAAARAAASRAIAPALAAVLREQQAGLAPSPARARNLDALAAGGTAVVVTGQQVGLFLGPLYTLYKAASAVAVARALEQESGVRCVPLFWLQTEDHDFAEIAGCHVAGADGQPVRVALADELPAQARSSVAHRALGPEVGGLVDRVVEALPPGPAVAELEALLRAHYAPGRSLAGAFAGLLGELFAADGLLLLDPRDARVAALAAPIYGASLEAAEAIDRRLQERAQWLAQHGFDVQVPVRAGCPLVFFHPAGPAGPRYRLQRAASPEVWALAGGAGEVAHGELLRALDGEPLRFSTSALLRPVVQDALLPAAAYVAGPGEINYLAQTGPLYDLFGVAPSLVMPRSRFRVVDAACRRALAALGLEAGDVARAPRELAARLPRAGAVDPAVDPADLRRRIAERITPVVDEIAAEVAALGPHLARPAQRTRAAVAHALGRLVERAAATLAERDEVTARRLDRLRAALYPGGVPQERFYAWPSLAGRFGPHGLTRLVAERLRVAGPFADGEQELLA
jgi:bacillithiol biosynthesis cysteine-adding enzyme BshC